MQENEIIAKLNILKTVKPSENWVFQTKSMILAEIGENKSVDYGSNYSLYDKLSEMSSLFQGLLNSRATKMAFSSLALVFFLLSGFLTFYTAGHSVPGDPLYSIKLANENLVLAMAPENEKAQIEMEQAGARLEELSKISQNTADVEQHQKVEQLVNNFEEKINNANNRLTKAGNYDEKKKMASVAKVINVQSAKYTEVLAKAKDSLPSVVKDKVSDRVDRAIASAEKINTTSLMVLVEIDNNAETAAQVKAKINKAEKSIESIEKSSVLPEEKKTDAKSAATESEKNVSAKDGANGEKGTDSGSSSDAEAKPIESSSLVSDEKAPDTAAFDASDMAKKEIEKAKSSLENNNLVDALKSATAAEEIASGSKTGNGENVQILTPVPAGDGSEPLK